MNKLLPKGKAKASSSRTPQSATEAFGAFSLVSNHSILSCVIEPLSLNSIRDPNIVVEFKGLMKKDAITKTKALQQLQILLDKQVEGGGAIDDAVLENWVCHLAFMLESCI